MHTSVVPPDAAARAQYLRRIDLNTSAAQVLKGHDFQDGCLCDKSSGITQPGKASVATPIRTVFEKFGIVRES